MNRFIHILIIGLSFIAVSFTKAQSQLLDSLSLDSVYLYTSIEEAMKEPDKVVRLELKKMKLKEVPAEVFKLKNLQYLDISRNNIKRIPDSLDLLPDLQHLNISRNKIEEIPKSIGKAANLRWFLINNNEITSIPYSIGQLEKLEYFDLWNNNLSYFPESMSKMRSLKFLDLRHILLNEDQQAKLKEMLPETTIMMDRACNCN